MPFFSIIIPLYNKAEFIRETVGYVLEQTFSDFEIVIVDDGSTDDGLTKISDLKDLRIKSFRQKNQGVSVARNKAMEIATGEYYCFLDGDDEWTPNHLESLYNAIQMFPNAGMYCGRYKTKVGRTHFVDCHISHISDDYEGYVQDFFESSFVNRVALTSAVCIKKEVFAEVGGFDKNISSGQDLDYWIRIALIFPVVICKEVTLIYNYLPDNKSLSKTKIINKTLPDFSKFANEEKARPNLKKFLDIYRIEYAMHFHISGNAQKKEFYLKDADPKYISRKAKVLFSTPPILLRFLLFGKRYLKRFGIDFSVYH